MNVFPDNPISNTIGNGVTEDKTLEAISKSGYPLQTIIVSKLSSEFSVQEEWSYIDRDSQDLRTLDILANKHLYDFFKDKPRVRPHLNLLIECKQSTLPYVFFLAPSRPWLPDFPIFSGLFHDSITLYSDDTMSTYSNPIAHIFGLDKHILI